MAQRDSEVLRPHAPRPLSSSLFLQLNLLRLLFQLYYGGSRDKKHGSVKATVDFLMSFDVVSLCRLCRKLLSLSKRLIVASTNR